MYLREIGWGGMDWIHLAWDRDQWMALVNLQVPSNVGKFLSSCATGGFSGRAQLHGVSALAAVLYRNYGNVPPFSSPTRSFSLKTIKEQESKRQ
jgi:hypothetical protein